MDDKEKRMQELLERVMKAGVSKTYHNEQIYVLGNGEELIITTYAEKAHKFIEEDYWIVAILTEVMK